MAKVRHTVPLLASTKRYTMHGALQHARRPERQQVADINEDRGVGIGSVGGDGDVNPAGWGVQLETWLAGEAEEEGEGTVV